MYIRLKREPGDFMLKKCGKGLEVTPLLEEGVMWHMSSPVTWGGLRVTQVPPVRCARGPWRNVRWSQRGSFWGMKDLFPLNVSRSTKGEKTKELFQIEGDETAAPLNAGCGSGSRARKVKRHVAGNLVTLKWEVRTGRKAGTKVDFPIRRFICW